VPRCAANVSTPVATKARVLATATAGDAAVARSVTSTGPTMKMTSSSTDSSA